MHEDLDAEFLGGSVALIVGVVDAEGRPRAVRGWGMTVVGTGDAGGALLRLLVDERDTDAVAHLPGGGAIAVTGADVPTLRACQVKGRVIAVEAPTAEDRALADRHRRNLSGVIADTDGYAVETVLKSWTDDVVACVLEVDELFDQTPGPAAGAAIRP